MTNINPVSYYTPPGGGHSTTFGKKVKVLSQHTLNILVNPAILSVASSISVIARQFFKFLYLTTYVDGFSKAARIFPIVTFPIDFSCKGYRLYQDASLFIRSAKEGKKGRIAYWGLKSVQALSGLGNSVLVPIYSIATLAKWLHDGGRVAAVITKLFPLVFIPFSIMDGVATSVVFGQNILAAHRFSKQRATSYKPLFDNILNAKGKSMETRAFVATHFSNKARLTALQKRIQGWKINCDSAQLKQLTLTLENDYTALLIDDNLAALAAQLQQSGTIEDLDQLYAELFKKVGKNSPHYATLIKNHKEVQALLKEKEAILDTAQAEIDRKALTNLVSLLLIAAGIGVMVGMVFAPQFHTILTAIMIGLIVAKVGMVALNWIVPQRAFTPVDMLVRKVLHLR